MDLTEDELRLVRWLADTSRQFSGDGTPHGWPDMIPAEVALRLAEKSYRRGVTQGSGYAIDEMRRGRRLKSSQEFAGATLIGGKRVRHHFASLSARSRKPLRRVIAAPSSSVTSTESTRPRV